MSSILKALRKLEEEKARRKGGSPDIARDILKSGPRQKRSFHWSGTVLGVFVVVSCLTAYVLIVKPKSPLLFEASGKYINNAPTDNSPSPGKDSDVAVDSQPVAQPVERTLGNNSDRAIIDKQARPSSLAVRGVTVSKQLPAPIKVTPSPVVEEKRPLDDPLPLLRLSGIAYQEERGARLAVVNDLPVMEGTMIEGARVEEIFQDRVRFVYAGRSVEVFLGQSTATK